MLELAMMLTSLFGISIGATAIQVYIDGKATLDPIKVADSLADVVVKQGTRIAAAPAMRKVLEKDVKEELCNKAEKTGSQIMITGITTSFLDESSTLNTNDNLTMVINGGKIVCFDTKEQCASTAEDITVIHLMNGHVLPGLIAVTSNLGLTEIWSESSTSDGRVSQDSSLSADNVVYAKYGIHLDGRGFARARIGGVTKAITPPRADGFPGGVSVGIKTNGKKTILNGGVFQDEVALHFSVGQGSKGNSLSTISSAVAKLRQIITENTNKDNVYGRAANGSFPLVVYVENEYDIQQLIKIKEDFPSLNLVIFGGSGAPLVADEIAKAKIPVILTANRGAPDTFEKRNTLPGPPLSKSPAAVLAAAGVKFGLAIAGEGDSHIHNIPIEAAWAAKYAGLSSKQAVDLVSRNIEEILGLDVRKENRDFVIFEGNPLEFGASVVIAIDAEDESVSMCWPESN
jgi:imidazolonepropionase-like amidohydrolase